MSDHISDLTGLNRSMDQLLRAASSGTELKPPSADATLDSMDAHTKDYIDARTEATRAQNDARFAEMLSKLDGLGIQLSEVRRDLDRVPRLWQIAGVVATGVVSMIALVAFASDRFDSGLSATRLVGDVEERQELRDVEQDARLDAILEAIRQIAPAN